MAVMPDRTVLLPRFAHAAGTRGFAGRVLENCAAGPLMAWERPAGGPRVYISAGIHGDEPAGPMALLKLMEADFFTPAVHWLLCPVLNPDGLAAGTRGNGDGRDLNRDYLKRRTPEVRAHAAWLESQPAPDLFLSLHEDWETTGFYFYEINLGLDVPPRAAAIIEAVRPWFPPQPGPDIDGHPPRADGWIYHEAKADEPRRWPEAIFLARLGCPLSFTFETPSRAPLARRIAAHMAAVKAAGDYLPAHKKTAGA
ncbi:MAG: M14 family metallocarboxypeptidase [Akkermansiaceae bacterium]|nr:M14 family metallocarboxypeptidase [Akkermansiaceae bacterium]